MDKGRRTTIAALLTGAVAGLAVVAARKGVPGAHKLATRMVKPVQPKVETKTYGYKEVNLS